MRGLVLIVATGLVGPLQAATFCVDTAAAFDTALSDASNNFENDEIRLEVGTYNAVPGGFTMLVDDSADVKISGGWHDLHLGNITVPCGLQTDSVWDTVLNGQSSTEILTVWALDNNLTIDISNLNFMNGHVPDDDGAGLFLLAADSATFMVRNCAFINNTGRFGSGLTASSDQLIVFNNLFALNTATANFAAASLTVTDGGLAQISNNTIVSNFGTEANDDGGLRIGGDGDAVLANNLAWGNDGVDLILMPTGAPYELLFNAYDSFSGATSASSTGNIFEPTPDFEDGLFNYRLKRTSELVDAGTASFTGWISAKDLDGLPRVIGPQIDIGAFENDVLIDNGFDGSSPF
ncbi:MAG: hypothetical protein DHS20C11_23550 [Lysobacteraceae bacterium]|nr:MAG: hypothetical protein DHS20C11_23550 [Xanthomonadaceae bacterium]